MGKLSSHDIDEILQEQQSGSHSKTFGEIALTWGLCQPEHIWKAWSNQLSAGFDQVDLQTFGIDPCHDVAYEAILACAVHTLQHYQQ